MVYTYQIVTQHPTKMHKYYAGSMGTPVKDGGAGQAEARRKSSAGLCEDLVSEMHSAL